jgi:hypothetical protein
MGILELSKPGAKPLDCIPLTRLQLQRKFAEMLI